MGATKLGVFNHCLSSILGERELASLVEESESRHALDKAWDKGGADQGGPIYCLELGYWNFATRTEALNYSPSVEPSFGYIRAFDKPVDWVRTTSVAFDPYFQMPTMQYVDEGDFWFADLDVIYVRYVSKDLSFGLDYSLWPMSFVDFVALYLADFACERLVKSDTLKEDVRKRWKEARHRANGIDGTNKPTQAIPMGTWAGSRYGGTWGRGSRGGER